MPPAGVRAQTAPESWEARDSYTPVGEVEDQADTLERISRRVKLTARTSQSTLDTIGELRRDFDGKLAQLSARVESLATELGAVLTGALEAERKERQQFTSISVSAFAADVEVDKTRALAAIEMERNAMLAGIESRKEASAYRRQLLLKVFSGIAAIWAVISTIVLARSG